MSNVYNKAHELVHEIKKSEEYKKYIELKEKAYENEKNKEMLEDYRKKLIETQLSQMTGEEIEDGEIEKLQKLEEIIMLNPTLKEFMLSELKFSQMIQDINDIIGEGTDLKE